MDWLFDAFPQLRGTPFRKTSEADPRYNCFAWAAGLSDVRWDLWDGQWPPECPPAHTLEAFECRFATIGYEACPSPELESGFEKIAIYCVDERPQHAARQLPNGMWTSKLGSDVDIEHTVEGLAGGIYGNVTRYMRRLV